MSRWVFLGAIINHNITEPIVEKIITCGARAGCTYVDWSKSTYENQVEIHLSIAEVVGRIMKSWQEKKLAKDGDFVSCGISCKVEGSFFALWFDEREEKLFNNVLRCISLV